MCPSCFVKAGGRVAEKKKEEKEEEQKVVVAQVVREEETKLRPCHHDCQLGANVGKQGYSGGVRCDGCRTRGQTAEFYSCVKCGHDMCPSCFVKAGGRVAEKKKEEEEEAQVERKEEEVVVAETDRKEELGVTEEKNEEQEMVVEEKQAKTPEFEVGDYVNCVWSEDPPNAYPATVTEIKIDGDGTKRYVVVFEEDGTVDMQTADNITHIPIIGSG
jgi:hypothetical protein